MRSKKWSIIVSLIIMGVSVLIFSILNFHCYTTCFKNWMISFMSSTALSDWKNFFIVISSGVLTSSMVTLLISISEYRVEKRRALENYVDANIHFCADFYNMLYMNISIPIELLQGYYAEQWSYSLKIDVKDIIPMNNPVILKMKQKLKFGYGKTPTKI